MTDWDDSDSDGAVVVEVAQLSSHQQQRTLEALETMLIPNVRRDVRNRIVAIILYLSVLVIVVEQVVSEVVDSGRFSASLMGLVVIILVATFYFFSYIVPTLRQSLLSARAYRRKADELRQVLHDVKNYE